MSKVFSLEINEYQTKIAHLEKRKKKIELLSLGYENTVSTFYTNPTDQAIELESKVITKLVNQLNIKESNVQIVIPDSQSFSQLMVMPKMKDEDLAKAMKLQVDEIVPLPMDETNVDFEIVSDLPDNKVLVLFVAVEKKIANHIAKTAELAKLTPTSLENDMAVLGRFFAEIHPFAKEPAVIVNLGFNATSYYAINPPLPYFQYTKTTKLGLATFLRDIKMNMNFKAAKSIQALASIGLSNKGSINLNPVISPLVNEIITEIKNSIQRMKEQYNSQVKHIYLLNYDSSIAYLHETVQNAVSIPTLSVPMQQILVPNAITNSFKKNIPSFLPVIAAHFR